MMGFDAFFMNRIDYREKVSNSFFLSFNNKKKTKKKTVSNSDFQTD